MQSISIDFVSQNDIDIRIDGEKITKVSGILLEIKIDETEKYCIEKNVFQQQMQEEMKNQVQPFLQDLRNINAAIRALKKENPDTSIGYSTIKRLIEKGEIAFKKNGSHYLVDLNEIKSYYANGLKKQKRNSKRYLKPIT